MSHSEPPNVGRKMANGLAFQVGLIDIGGFH